MLSFPQLISGAGAQYPIVKRRLSRTVMNEAADGRTIKLADTARQAVEWELELEGLTTAEWNEIETLFRAVEGRLGTFTFLDPADNLLGYSEQLSSAVWVKDPLLVLTEGIADPQGTTRAARLVNGAAAPQRIWQELPVPASYQYCLSVYARSDAAGQAALFLRTATAEDSKVYGVTPEWRRLVHAGRLAATEDSVRFGLELAPGQAVTVFGFQAEGQPGASRYRKTPGRGGVYANTRFGEDRIELVTDAPERHRCRLRVVARLED